MIKNRNNGERLVRDLGISWRSPSGAIEDRNVEWEGLITGDKVWRSPFGAPEDRNWKGWVFDEIVSVWRSPSGATEHRNPYVDCAVIARPTNWRPPFEAAEDRNTRACAA
jgi:hypothetical protein